MRHLVIGVVLALAGFTSVSAEPYSCSKYEGYSASENADSKAQYAKFCIDDQKTIIGGIADAVQFAYSAGRDSLHIVKTISLTALSSADRIGVKATSLNWQLGDKLRPDREYGQDVFSFLRSSFADQARLRSFYEVAKPVLRSRFLETAVVGVVSDALKENEFLFKKSLASVASQAGAWYSYTCGDSVESWSEFQRQKCETTKLFAAKFEEYYGVAPTKDSAWVLGFLHRRHREGGTRVVAEWQRIALDFASEPTQ